MSQIRLLSMDFDGTLVRDWATPPYPEMLVRTLNQLRRNGVLIAINTGRTIRHGGRRSGIYGISRAARFCVDHRKGSFPVDRVDMGRLWRMEFTVPGRARCALRENRETAPGDRRVCGYQDGCPALFTRRGDLRSGLHNQSGDGRDLPVHRSSSLGFPDFAYQRNSIYLRFCHIAYHKGTALAELQRLTEISRDDTFAAGDNFNDLPMLNLSFARFLACPSNAIDDVKEAVRSQGGFVATQDSGLGVHEALRYFFPSLLSWMPERILIVEDELSISCSA